MFTAEQLIQSASMSMSDMGNDDGFSLTQLDAIANAFHKLSTQKLLQEDIVIIINQGAVVDVNKPANYRIVIHDYDVQEEEGDDIKLDGDGDPYQEIVWE